MSNIKKAEISQLSNDKGLGVADRVFITNTPPPGEHLGLFLAGKKNIKFSLPLPPTKHDTR
jgi:hypothetical protein